MWPEADRKMHRHGIFVQALDIIDRAKHGAFSNEACCEDERLLQQAKDLLHTHEREDKAAGEFPRRNENTHRPGLTCGRLVCAPAATAF